ncbi:hypothetical protein THASP1DRAFT_33661 [Thamnocephalis sphaerospora]|uniref:Uncharacterized protein n=1 Tax=Thamnocephalis sphaerospora TaxID=78915 RepID=A0A4V1IVM3_9FUNG|nr:hypothetical protein THASP1DRAFT_33661 [Thamnocephalis sphaerospora]|eukprot:RKP04559.1 hypothetical protein THASP1DRAFT_33661 [Thamnocephalis sphaerospora]
MSENPKQKQQQEQQPTPSRDEQAKEDDKSSLVHSKESKSTKSTSSISSFEDFSKYCRDLSKESLGKNHVPDATPKEREDQEAIKKLLEEQEKETARRQAEAEKAIKSETSSESIDVVHKRMTMMKKKKIEEMKLQEGEGKTMGTADGTKSANEQK